MTRQERILNYPNLSLAEIRELIRQKKEHITDLKINPYNGDSEWAERCSENWWSVNYKGVLDARQKKLLPLRDKLLSTGGVEVCLPIEEEDLDDILKYGQLWDNLTVKYMTGRPSKCHSNSAALWDANRDSYKDGHAVIICTGYALSDDGVWRQHSWLVHAKSRANNLIETTVPRIAYFGFGMPFSMAEDFYWENQG